METVDARTLPTVPTAPTTTTTAVSILPRFSISAPKGDTIQFNTTLAFGRIAGKNAAAEKPWDAKA